MCLEKDIKQWDGKSKEDIHAIFLKNNSKKNFAPRLINLYRKIDIQKGVTWLLKIYIDNGGAFSESESAEILAGLGTLTHWESKLHILQLMHSLHITQEFKIDTEQFVKKLIIDENKFVRAWAYNGFYLLAKVYPEYRKEANHFFEMALKDEAPSVKARIRNIMKAGF